MARVVKSAEVRRGEILQAAYRLFSTVGYEATTVNAILDELGLSKGAFYHHFASKEEVLEALAVQMADAILAQLRPITERRDLTAVDKLNLYFGFGARYKREHVAMARGLADIYTREENQRLRLRLFAASVERVSPWFARILDEGMRDGTFTIEDPVETSRLLLHLGNYLHDSFGEAWRRAETDLAGAAATYLRRIETYTRAIEGILGLEPHTLKIVDDPSLITLFLTREKP